MTKDEWLDDDENWVKKIFFSSLKLCTLLPLKINDTWKQDKKTRWQKTRQGKTEYEWRMKISIIYPTLLWVGRCQNLRELRHKNLKIANLPIGCHEVWCLS